MAGTKLLSRWLTVLAVSARLLAQDASQFPSQTTSPSSPSPSRTHPVHHVQVPDEDSPGQAPELAQAETEIDKKNYSAAEVNLRNLVARDATSYVAWFDLGFVENELGNVNASIEAYRKAVAAKPDIFESNLNLGLQLAKTGQPGAEEFLRAATKLKPTDHVVEGKYRAWIALGDALEKSKLDEALAAYRHAAELQPKEAEPHFASGKLLEQDGKSAEAEIEYKEAMALDSAAPDAVIALANLYMRGRRFPEAENSLRALLAQNPDLAAAQIQLGRVLAAEGKNEDAIQVMQEEIRRNPGDENVQRDIAEIYSTAGRNDLAEASYRALVTAHPNDAELHRRLGQSLLREKKFPEAQQEFMLTVKLKPDMGEAYGDLAFAAGENGDFALAIRALDARARLLPEIPITYFLRASAYDHLHDYKKAAANYRDFLKTANGQYPDYEWKAKHRLIAIEPKK